MFLKGIYMYFFKSQILRRYFAFHFLNCPFSLLFFPIKVIDKAYLTPNVISLKEMADSISQNGCQLLNNFLSFCPKVSNEAAEDIISLVKER